MRSRPPVLGVTIGLSVTFLVAFLMVAPSPASIRSPVTGPLASPSPSTPAQGVPAAAIQPRATVGGHILNTAFSPPRGVAASDGLVAVDSSLGLLYSLNLGAGSVTSSWVSNATFDQEAILSHSLNYPFYADRIAVDPVHHNVYVAVIDYYATSGWIDVLDGSSLQQVGNVSTFYGPKAAFFQPFDLIYDPSTQHMIAENNSAASNAIDFQAVDTSTYGAVGSGLVFCSAVSGCVPDGLTTGPNELIVSTRTQAYSILNTTTLAGTTFVNFFRDPNMQTGSVAYDPVHNWAWFVNASPGAQNVVAYNLSVLAPVGNVTLVYPYAVAYDEWSQTIIVSGLSDVLSTNPIIDVFDSSFALLHTTTIPSVPFTYITELVVAGGSSPTLYLNGRYNGTTLSFTLLSAAPYLSAGLTFPSIALYQSSLVVDSARGEYFILTEDPSGIQAVSISTGAVLWTSYWRGLVCPNGNPGTFQVDPAQGLLYVADWCIGNVTVISEAGGSVLGNFTVTSPLNWIGYGGLDTTNHILYFSDVFDTNIWVYNTSGGGVPTLIGNLNAGASACGIAPDPALRTAFISTCGSTVIEISPVSLAAVKTITTGSTYSFGIALTPGGTLLVGDGVTHNVSEINSTTSVLLGNITLGPLHLPAQLTVDASDNFLFIDSPPNGPDVLIANLTAGTVQATVTAPAYLGGGGFDPATGTYFGPSYRTGQTFSVQVVPFPGIPSGLSAIPGNNSVSLSWSASLAVPGYPVLNYTVQRATSVSGPWTTDVVVLGPSSSVTVSGLTNGVRYYFSVYASSNAGRGAPATPANAVPAGVPYPPTRVNASAVNTSAVHLVWTAPATDDGSAITGYTISYSTSLSGPWTNLSVPNVLKTNVTGLASGTTYYFRVAATNAVGTGHFNGPVAASTAKPASSLLSGANLYLLIGVIVVIAAVAAVLALVMRRRRKGAMAPPAAWSGAAAPPYPGAPETGGLEPPPGAMGLPPPPPPSGPPPAN
jgi:fibronectin type III domain protein